MSTVNPQITLGRTRIVVDVVWSFLILVMMSLIIGVLLWPMEYLQTFSLTFCTACPDDASNFIFSEWALFPAITVFIVFLWLVARSTRQHTEGYPAG